MTQSQAATIELELVNLDHWGMSPDANVSDDDQTPGKDLATFELSENDSGSEYHLTLESLPQEGVPAGKYFHFRWTSHTVYPGVPSSVYLYLPHGAEEAESVNLMVCLDGLYYVGEQCGATTVLDNLVHKGEIPMTVGLFHNPGETGPGYPIYGGSTNRAVEYDSVNEDFARFLGQSNLDRACDLFLDYSPGRPPRAIAEADHQKGDLFLP